MKTLYVHIPFCLKKCFYCSFAVSVGQQHRIDEYLDCLKREAEEYHGEMVESIYFGGGTPTFLDCAQLEKLFTIIHKDFCFPSSGEWTIEANPEGLNQEKLALLKAKGVNRVSLGVQSLNDKYLKYLGRNHNAATAQQAFRAIRQTGFNNVNVDLMVSFPNQTMEELKKDVEDVLRLESEHVSLYMLSIEERSRFYTRDVKLADDHFQAQQYQMVCELLEKTGFKQYEISNFAKGEKASQHNLNYWQGGHYIGLGLGAHSYIDTKRFWNCLRMNDYLACLQKGVSAVDGCEELTSFDQMKEVVLFGLRMNSGVDIRNAEKRFGCLLTDEQNERIRGFIDGGFLVLEKGFLKTTLKGRLVLDELCAQLVN